MKHLQYFEPLNRETRSGKADILVLLDLESNEVHRYLCYRSFLRIQYRDLWYRVNGQDRDTGEIIYIQEQELIGG